MKDFLQFFLQHLLRGWLFKQLLSYGKKKGLLLYVKSLEKVRLSLIGLLALFFVLQLMSLGFVVALVSGAFLLPLEPEQKLLLLLSVGALFFLVPLGILIYVLSSRVWLEKSGAKDMLS